MITKQDLIEAIAECEGTKNPNANTCIKLAAYYTIFDNLYGASQAPTNTTENVGYSYDSGVPDIELKGDSDFAEIVRNKTVQKAFPAIEELVETIHLLNPRLYDSFINKLSEV